MPHFNFHGSKMNICQAKEVWMKTGSYRSFDRKLSLQEISVATLLEA